jgi:hypothetical protein
MSGHEKGARNIFPLVQETLRRFIPEVRDGDNLTIIGFDETSRILSAAIPKTMRSHSDREAVVQLINGLMARGPWTQTGLALKDALNEVYSRSDKNRPAAIILFTDGREDVRGIRNPVRIPDAIRLIRDRDIPYVFYVSLGTEPDPGLKKFLDEINTKAFAENKKARPHGLLFDDPGAAHLAEEARRIRDTIEGLRWLSLGLEPKALDLGRMRPGGPAREGSVELWSPLPTTVRLELLEIPADYNIEGIPDTLTCGPEQWNRAQFSVSVADTADRGPHSFKLRVEPIEPPVGLDPTPQYVNISLVVRQTLWGSFLKLIRLSAAWIARHWWILLLLIILILLVVYFLWRWYIYDETPVDIVRRVLARWQPPAPAILRTPDGEIRLQQSIKLGAEGSVLKRSSATVAIHRVGNDYILRVEKGTVVVIDPSGLFKSSIGVGNDELKLKNKMQMMMPGYSSPVMYVNNSSAVRRR